MKLKILWVSPLPPVPSGVSDYAVEILEYLSKIASVRVVAPPDIRVEGVPETCEITDVATSLLPGEIPLVHMGNNPYHEWLIPWCSYPHAVVVLHDLILHHLLVESTAGRENRIELGKKLRSEYGEEGAAIYEARRFGLHGRLDPFLFPALRSMVGKASTLICHSEFGLKRLKSLFPQRLVYKMPLAAADPGPVDRVALRKKYGVDSEELLLMHMGFLSREKGLSTILRALAAVRDMGIRLRFLLAGWSLDGEGILGRVINDLGLKDIVISTGWLEKEDMMQLPAAADLGIILRQPSAGETSAAVLRFLACGTPVGINALHQYLEWPEDVALRLTPGPSTEADIIRLLVRATREDFSRENGKWSTRRDRARRVYEESHRPGEAARSIVNFLESLS